MTKIEADCRMKVALTQLDCKLVVVTCELPSRSYENQDRQ